MVSSMQDSAVNERNAKRKVIWCLCFLFECICVGLYTRVIFRKNNFFGYSRVFLTCSFLAAMYMSSEQRGSVRCYFARNTNAWRGRKGPHLLVYFCLSLSIFSATAKFFILSRIWERIFWSSKVYSGHPVEDAKSGTPESEVVQRHPLHERWYVSFDARTTTPTPVILQVKNPLMKFAQCLLF